MTSLPIKKTQSPHAVIDGLIADFGLKSVLLAIAGRILRGRKTTDSADFPGLIHQRGVDQLSDHLRRDMGLPHDIGRKITIDPIVSMRGDFF